MVYGIDRFAKAFEAFADNYIIIGGTACDAVLEGSTMRARATDDIDMIIVVEKLTPEFVDAFWAFIREGGYRNGKRKRGEDKAPVYELYRFSEPAEGYPVQIELLARHSDLLGEPSGFHIEPIPTDEEQYSLSAIMLDDAYYNLTVGNSKIIGGIRVASPVSLIGLKERAFLNLLADREKGKRVNTKDITKHRNDVLKLAAVVAPGPYPCDADVSKTNVEYIAAIRGMVPSQALRDALGVSDEQIEDLIETLENLYIEEQP